MFMKTYAKHLPTQERSAVTAQAVTDRAAQNNPAQISNAAFAQQMGVTQGALFRHAATKYPGISGRLVTALTAANATRTQKLVIALVQRYKQQISALIAPGQVDGRVSTDMDAQMDAQMAAQTLHGRMQGRARRLLAPTAICGALLVSLSACTTVGPDYAPPATKLQSAWANQAELGLTVQAAQDKGGFWASFKDPDLLEVIAHANRNSPTLASAAQAVNQAQASLRSNSGSRLPAASLTVSKEYNRPSMGSPTGDAVTQQVLGLLSWEMDFWGKWRRTLEGDHANVQVSQAALDAARVSLEASVASTYLSIRMMEKRIAVAKANLAEQKENLRIAEARYRLGATSELDYRQALTQYEQTNSTIPSEQISLAQYQHALSVLLGEPPDYFAKHYTANKGMPQTPGALPLGAPADLLRRRPDVFQAEMNAAVQSARIGQAQAALYPSFTLNGTIGYSTTNGLDQLFKWDNRAVAYGVGFNLPLFDRGSLKALVTIQDSLFAQAVLAYQNQVLKAQQDVEDSLASIRHGSAQLAALRRADAAAARSATLAQLQYRAGQVDYTTVSNADQARLSTSDSVVQTEGAVLQGYISAFRALGGDWLPKDAPAASPPVPPTAHALDLKDAAP